VRPDDFADVVIDVEGRVGVLVGELTVAIRACKVLVGDAAEGDVEPLRGRVALERQREIEADAGIAGRVRRRRIERQVVLARAENEFVGQRRRERGRDVERAVPGRRLFEDQVSVLIWSWAASAVTSTELEMSPISRTVTPVDCLSDALTTMPDLTNFLKPGASIVTVYVPGWMIGKV
jgi:hypothetical protein